MNAISAKTFLATWLTLMGLAALPAPASAATADGPSVMVAWDASTNAGVTNYNLYYGVASGVYTNQIAVGSNYFATISGLVPGVTYYFAATADDTDGRESPYSNESSYTVPFSTTSPFISTQPTNQTVLLGSGASFSVTAEGAQPMSYQWYFNGVILIGATHVSLTLTNVQSSQYGSYSVLVSNSYGSLLSSSALLIQGALPNIKTQPSSQSVEFGCTAFFNVSAGGTAPLSYQWLRNGAPLFSQTNSTLAVADVRNSEFGDYSVIVNNPFGAVTSSVVELALAVPPTTGPCIVQRFARGGVRINVSMLTSNDTVARYDSLTVTAVSPNSAAGGTVSLESPYIYYAPPAGAPAADSFNYTVSDGHCGTAEGTVKVEPVASNPQPTHFSIAPSNDGSLELSFDGVPGEKYQLQYTDVLSSPNWQTITNQVTDEFGVFRFTEWPVAEIQARFFRVGTSALEAGSQPAP